MYLGMPSILGGSKAVTIDASQANRWPILTEEDKEALLQVLEEGNLSLNLITRKLEDDYCTYFGVRHALTHCNGTAALLAAFFALDLKPGDEVLVPSATFWASVVPMLWLGALPVFCESEFDRMGLDPYDVEQKITSRSRAIVVTHLWGMPSKMTEILEIARRYDLKIIEDASHAHGATWRGEKCGTIGDIGVLSLQNEKLAPAGEGGIFLTNNPMYLERAICLGDINRILELQSTNRRFAATSFGIKTRMAPLSAAVGQVQLRHLDERNSQRRKNLVYLSQNLERLGFNTFLPPSHIERVYFEFLIRHDPKTSGMPIELLVKALRAEGCDVEVARYPLLHQQPLFIEGQFRQIARLKAEKDALTPKFQSNDLPRTQNGSRNLIKLPTFPSAERNLLDQYVHAFEKVLNHANEISVQEHRNDDG